MNNKISILSYIGIALLTSSCSVRIPAVKTPSSKTYTTIDQTVVTDGYPKKAAPWIVYSDREGNTAFLKKEKNESPQEIKFLEPLLVIAHNKSKKLIKVGPYDADALLKKTPKKSLKSYGWVSENNLLTWSQALKERKTGFTMKAAVGPNKADVLNNASAYIQNDSALVYSTPLLTDPLKKKIALGQLVYVYKKSYDDKGYLIGSTPKVSIDSIQNELYGWISSNMISSWGERSAIKLDRNHTYSNYSHLGIYHALPQHMEGHPTLPMTEASYRTPIENIFPLSTYFNDNNTKYFTHVFDYSNNFIYNAAGQKLKYNRFKEIVKKAKNLNIVFTLDISAENSAFIPISKSIIQDVQLNKDKFSFFNKVNYSVVLYRNNSCGPTISRSEPSGDFNNLFTFMDEVLSESACERYSGQPVNEALSQAGSQLGLNPDETNLIILIGATSSTGSNSSNTVREISRAKAKIISFQTQSKASDTYNNFVLLSENVVTSTSSNIAELNKEKVADQSMVTSRNNFNLIEGESGVYSLDYPNQSMTQGFVIYPKRREANNNSLLINALDSLISQVKHENLSTEKSLTSYFKSELGSNKTKLDGRYNFMFKNSPDLLPWPIAASLVAHDYPMLTPGHISEELKSPMEGVQRGILVSEYEYENLRLLYLEIYNETKPNNSSFNQGRAISKYVNILNNYLPNVEELSKNQLYRQPMRFAVINSTGFDVSIEEIMSDKPLKSWKKTKLVPKNYVQDYFKNYKKLADRLHENRNNPKIKIIQNGTTFYWLNEYFMPTVSDSAMF